MKFWIEYYLLMDTFKFFLQSSILLVDIAFCSQNGTSTAVVFQLSVLIVHTLNGQVLLDMQGGTSGISPTTTHRPKTTLSENNLCTLWH